MSRSYTVERKSHMTENSRSISETLVDSRIIFLNSAIDSDSANAIIAMLLYLDSLNHEDINIYISSPGGSVDDGLAIIDAMECVQSNVNTIAIGAVASMATVILACGHRRSALKHSRIMIHQVFAGMQGTLSDVTIAYNEVKKAKDCVTEILAEKTGKSTKQIEKDCDRDFWMNAREATEYGLIDDVIIRKQN